jgi:hypothetical protein
MVVDDFDVVRACRVWRPFKTYPPFVIDADAVLAFAVALQILETVSGQR